MRRADGGWVFVGDLSRATVPPTVTALLAARLDRLPPPERALLERISVIGLEVTTADATALSSDGVDVPALLASLSRRDLLRFGPPADIASDLTADEDGWCPTAPVLSYESRRTHANLIGRLGHE